MPRNAAPLVFAVPNGRLVLGDGDLDTWAEHLTWCYRRLGVPDGATIAVQDFGASPLSFLGSSLLMPLLEAGVAERLKGKFVCLDASGERVALTPAIIRQLSLDALVVRADLVSLLLEVSRRSGLDLERQGPMVIVSFDGTAPSFPHNGRWRSLLHVESALLLAPECARCGCFHLREGWYQIEGDQIRNLRLRSAKPWRIQGVQRTRAGQCEDSPGDQRVQLRSPDGSRSIE